MSLWEIPDSPEFRIAFVIVTVLYIAVMAVLIVLYCRSAARLSKKLKKPGSENESVRSRPHTHRQPVSGTESDPEKPL